MNRNDGFSVVEGILIVVVVAIIIAVGRIGYSNFIAPKLANQTGQVSTNSDATVRVESAKDLDAASMSIDTLPIDDSDSAQLDSAVSSFMQ